VKWREVKNKEFAKHFENLRIFENSQRFKGAMGLPKMNNWMNPNILSESGFPRFTLQLKENIFDIFFLPVKCFFLTVN
jgi:hypothetical protein